MFFLRCCVSLKTKQLLHYFIETWKAVFEYFPGLLRQCFSRLVKTMLIRDWFIFIWSQGLLQRTCSHEVQSKFWGVSPCDWSYKCKPVWIRGTSFGEQNSVTATKFSTKIGSSRGGTWSTRPVPATGPSCVGTLRKVWGARGIGQCTFLCGKCN